MCICRCAVATLSKLSRARASSVMSPSMFGVLKVKLYGALLSALWNWPLT
jgi:hypothetical protein